MMRPFFHPDLNGFNFLIGGEKAKINTGGIFSVQGEIYAVAVLRGAKRKRVSRINKGIHRQVVNGVPGVPRLELLQLICCIHHGTPVIRLILYHNTLN